MKLDKNFASVSSAVLVLDALEHKDMYGYQIITELTERSGNLFEFQEGTLYPVLYSLERDGCLESYCIVADNGRKRKYYRITDEGKKLLKKKKREWKVFSQAMNGMLGEV